MNAKISNFGAIFEFESEGKKSLAKEIMALKAAMEKMATMLGREKNKNRDLNEEIRRLN